MQSTSTGTATFVQKTSQYNLSQNGAAAFLSINGDSNQASGSFTTNSFGVVKGTYDQQNINLSLNGVTAAQPYPSTIASSGNPVTIGGTSTGANLDGDIAEVMIFNTVMTNTQMEDLDAYLYNRYQVIPTALPSWWLQQYGLTGANALPNADPANDGLTNWQKYLMKLDPTYPDNPTVKLQVRVYAQ